MYSKRRINLGRRSKKSSNKTLKRLRGGSSSSSSIESPNDNELPQGFSPVEVATWYPQGTTILKINRKGEREYITLDTERILQSHDLGDEIIGVKKPTVITSSRRRRGKKATAIRYQQQRADELEAKKLARWNYGTDKY